MSAYDISRCWDLFTSASAPTRFVLHWVPVAIGGENAIFKRAPITGVRIFP
jgi:hypothetical protein